MNKANEFVDSLNNYLAICYKVEEQDAVDLKLITNAVKKLTRFVPSSEWIAEVQLRDHQIRFILNDCIYKLYVKELISFEAYTHLYVSFTKAVKET